MATISERLAYVLTFDTSSGVKSLNKLGSTADKELGRAEKKLDKMSAGLSKFGAGAVAFAGLAGAGLVKVAMGASDLEESINAVRVTFGEAGEGILQLGRDAAKAVGLSNVEFNGLAVQFSSFAEKVAGEGGDVVQTLADMTGRAADFASVMNIDVAQAATIFQSGLAGETEPLKKFGIDLSAAAVGAFAVANGISASASAMSEADKVQARYGLLMEQTAKTAGDFANTSDGMANQQRILKAEFKNLSDGIGAGVLPMLTELVSVGGKAVGVFSRLSPEMQGTIGKFGALGVAGVGLIGTMSFVAGQAIKMRNRFTTLGVDGSRSMTKLGKAVGAASLAFAAFAAAETAFQILNTISDSAGKAKRGLEGFAIAAGAVADGTGTATAVLGEFNTLVTVMDHELKASHLWEDFGKKIKVVGTESARNIEDIDRAFSKTLDTSAAAAQVLLDSWSAQADALDHSSGQYKDNISLIERYQERVDSQVGAQDALTGSLNESTDATEDAAVAVEDATEAAEALSAAVAENAEKYYEAVEATEALTAAQVAAVPEVFSLEKAQLNLSIAVDDYRQKQIDTTLVLEDSKATDAEKVVALQSLRVEQIGLAEELFATTVEYAKQQGATEGSTAAAQFQIAELLRLKEQYPEVANEVDIYIAKLAEIPGTVSTDIQALIDEGELSTAEALLNNVARNRTAMIDIVANNRSATVGRTPGNMPATDFGGVDFGSAFFGAAGGLVTRPTKAVIGESGPELVLPVNKGALDGAPGASPLSSMLGGLSPTDAAAITAAVEQGMIRGFRGIRQNERAS
jgi:hypothetical protein